MDEKLKERHQWKHLVNALGFLSKGENSTLNHERGVWLLDAKADFSPLHLWAFLIQRIIMYFKFT